MRSPASSEANIPDWRWIGIVLFFLVALRASVPDENYIMGADGVPMDEPRRVSELYVLCRLGVSLTLFVLLIWYFRLRPQGEKASRGVT